MRATSKEYLCCVIQNMTIEELSSSSYFKKYFIFLDVMVHNLAVEFINLCSCSIHPFEVLISFLLDKYSGEELLDHMIVQFLIFFWGTSMLFFITTAPVFIHTYTAWELQFLLMFAFVFLITTIPTGDSSLWSWFAFPWWLMMFTYLLVICMSLEKWSNQIRLLVIVAIEL